jgi:hypothetical protein
MIETLELIHWCKELLSVILLEQSKFISGFAFSRHQALINYFKYI